MTTDTHLDVFDPSNTKEEGKNLEVPAVPSPVLTRLVDEVRNDEEFAARAYNRTHNRHNRSR